MSEERPHGATPVHPSKDPDGNGNGSKWLLGAAAAVVLIGGGALALNTMNSNQDRPQSAYNDPYAADSTRAGPLDSDDDTLAQSASTDDAIAPRASRETRSATARRAPVRTASAEDAVPQETIGVTPASVTTDSTDSEEIIVPGQRRPIWVRTPSERRLSALYPARALERGREGEASLNCTVLDNGALNCVRAYETPGGFGPAAIRVANTLRHAPQLADGSSAAGTPVNLRVVFRMADEPRRG